MESGFASTRLEPPHWCHRQLLQSFLRGTGGTCLMSSVLWANDYCSSCSGGTLVINLTFAHGPIALDGKNRHEWGPKGTGTNSVGYLAFITGFLLGRIPEMGFLYFKTKHVTVITYLFTIFANIFRSSLQYRPEHISVLGARRFWPLYWLNI